MFGLFCGTPSLFNQVEMANVFVLLSILLIAKAVLGFGKDPDIQIDIINELDMANATFGIVQVAGLHNNIKAFLFRARTKSGGKAAPEEDKSGPLFLLVANGKEQRFNDEKRLKTAGSSDYPASRPNTSSGPSTADTTAHLLLQQIQGIRQKYGLENQNRPKEAEARTGQCGGDHTGTGTCQTTAYYLQSYGQENDEKQSSDEERSLLTPLVSTPALSSPFELQHHSSHVLKKAQEAPTIITTTTSSSSASSSGPSSLSKLKRRLEMIKANIV